MVTDAAFGPIASLTGQNGLTGTGLYLLTGVTARTGPSQQTYLQLTLEDATGRITGVVWPEAAPAVACPAALPCPVAVRGTCQPYHGTTELKIESLAAVTPDAVPHATALLPCRRCPEVARSALARLAELEAALPTPLAGFLREVLLDPQITLPFLCCRASVAHHHAYPGGLLVHSTEMLDLVGARTHQIIPDDPWSPYLAQLGYLFHDLGKLRSVGAVRRPAYALVVRHEQLTIELLAPHLRWLELRNPGLATALRYVFGYLATPAKARGVPEYVVAEVVATLDQWSAAGHNRRDLDHLLGGMPGRDAPAPRTQPARNPARSQPQTHYAYA